MATGLTFQEAMQTTGIEYREEENVLLAENEQDAIKDRFVLTASTLASWQESNISLSFKFGFSENIKVGLAFYDKNLFNIFTVSVMTFIFFYKNVFMFSPQVHC